MADFFSASLDLREVVAFFSGSLLLRLEVDCLSDSVDFRVVFLGVDFFSSALGSDLSVVRFLVFVRSSALSDLGLAGGAFSSVVRAEERLVVLESDVDREAVFVLATCPSTARLVEGLG